MKELTGNNGNQLAEIMHKEGLLQDELSLNECEDLAICAGIVSTERQRKWLKNDDFWGDFCYRMGELGYKVAC